MAKGWTADDLLELARGYQPACILMAAAELEVFDVLDGKDLTAGAVAERIGADLRGTATLLDALAALGVVEKRTAADKGDTSDKGIAADKGDSSDACGVEYHLAPYAAHLLTSGSPATVLPMLQHQATCLRRWSQLAAVVQTGDPAPRQPSVRGEACDEAAFIGAMDVICAPIASKVIEESRVPPFKHLLDIGGASGTWTIAFLNSYPEATATVFDLPHVIPMAEARLTAAGLRDRVELVAGDFTKDALPGGADVAWLSAIVHQNSRRQNVDLFTSIARALTDGGRLLIRDMVMDDTRTEPTAGALFAINMLVATEGGGTFTFDELRDDLQAAGFGEVALVRHDQGMNSVVAACKAGAGPTS